jgi:hypothetical protein
VELHTGFIDDPARQPVERVNLANDGSLADASEARVTGACPQVVDARCDQGCPRAGPGCGGACFGSSMSAADYDDIEGPA